MCSTGLHTPDMGLENMKEMRKVWLAIHCTGLKVIHEFEKAFPTAFVLNASGTTIHL